MSSDNDPPIPSNDDPTLHLPEPAEPAEPAEQVTLPTETPKTPFTDGMEEPETEDAGIHYRYRQQHMLGKGGNGMVISVFDRKMNRPVALKITNSTQAERSAKLRFLREAQVTGQLNHPNVMPVYDIGTNPSGQVFFTMKEVQGESLAQRIRAGIAGSQVERLMVFRQVCNAIAFAHSRGVLHRDIKPANVMVGEYGEVLVVDWGLCKVLGENPDIQRDHVTDVSDDELMTQAGDVAGTPAFMAPEQARGAGEELDTRTDVYALGALLYTLLLEIPPFKGEVVRVLERVIHGDYRPPRDVDKRRVPRELDAIVQKAMQTKMDDRYQTVAALSDDVQAFLEKRPVSVLRYSPLQRAAKWASRNQRVVRPVGLTSALAAAALVSGGLLHFNRVSQARDAAVAEAARATIAEREAVIEAINGRAALAASEALYGRAGSALQQLTDVRNEMMRLDTDTLRADIGMAMLKRSAVQPTPLNTDKANGRRVQISKDGSRFAAMGPTAIEICPTNDPSQCTTHALPESPKRIFGPWTEAGPWTFNMGSKHVEALHPVTGETQQFERPFDDCQAGLLTFANGWLTQECYGTGTLQWSWTDRTDTRFYPSTDVERRVMGISEDGNRLLVHRFIDSTSQHDARFSVIDQGSSIWEAPRGSLNVLSPDGQWILNSSATGFNAEHLNSGAKQRFNINVPESLIWRNDSTGFTLVKSTGELVHYRIERNRVTESHRTRLALASSIMGRVTVDQDHQRFVFYGNHEPHLFTLEQTDRPILDLNLSTETETTTESVMTADGHLLATGTDSGQIVIVDTKTGWVLHSFSVENLPVRGLSFNPDGSRLISGHWDGKARIWDMETGAVVREYAPTKASAVGGPPKITEVLYIDDERVLITGGDGHIGVWSTRSNTLLNDFSGTLPYVWDSLHSADTNLLVVSNRLGRRSDSRAAILDLQSNAVVKLIPGQTESYGMALSPDGTRFVLTSNDGTAKVVNIDGTIEHSLTIATPPAYAAAWSPDGSIVAVSDYSGRYQLWTTDNWEMVADFGHGVIASALLFAPNSRTLHIVTGSGAIYVLDLNSPASPVAADPEWLSGVRANIKANNLQAAFDSAQAAIDGSELARVWAGVLQKHLSPNPSAESTQDR